MTPSLEAWGAEPSHLAGLGLGLETEIHNLPAAALLKAVLGTRSHPRGVARPAPCCGPRMGRRGGGGTSWSHMPPYMELDHSHHNTPKGCVDLSRTKANPSLLRLLLLSTLEHGEYRRTAGVWSRPGAV